MECQHNQEYQDNHHKEECHKVHHNNNLCHNHHKEGHLVKIKTAIKANYFNEFANVKALQEQKVSPGKDPEQEKLFALSQTGGWTVLKEYMERVMEELDNLTKTQMAQGISFEEIGRSTVIKELSKDVIRRIIQHVTDAREAGESRGTAEV